MIAAIVAFTVLQTRRDADASVTSNTRSVQLAEQAIQSIQQDPAKSGRLALQSYGSARTEASDDALGRSYQVLRNVRRTTTSCSCAIDTLNDIALGGHSYTVAGTRGYVEVRDRDDGQTVATVGLVRPSAGDPANPADVTAVAFQASCGCLAVGDSAGGIDMLRFSATSPHPVSIAGVTGDGSGPTDPILDLVAVNTSEIWSVDASGALDQWTLGRLGWTEGTETGLRFGSQDVHLSEARLLPEARLGRGVMPVVAATLDGTIVTDLLADGTIDRAGSVGGATVQASKAEGLVNAMAESETASGLTVAIASTNGVRVLQALTWAPVANLAAAGPVSQVQFSANGDLVTWVDARGLEAATTDTTSTIRTTTAYEASVSVLDTPADDGTTWLSSDDHTLQLVGLEPASGLITMPPSTAEAWSGNRLLVSQLEEQVRSVTLAAVAPSQLPFISADTDPLYEGTTYSANGSYDALMETVCTGRGLVAAVGRTTSATEQLWSWTTKGRLLHTAAVPNSSGSGNSGRDSGAECAISRGGDEIAVTSGDTLTVWDTSSGHVLLRRDEHDTNTLGYTSAGLLVGRHEVTSTGSSREAVDLFRPRSGQLRSTDSFPAAPGAVAIASNGDVATTDGGGNVTVRDSRGLEISSAPVDGDVLAMAFDQSAARLAVATGAGKVVFVRSRDGRRVLSDFATTFGAEALDLEWSPNGRSLAVLLVTNEGGYDWPAAVQVVPTDPTLWRRALCHVLNPPANAAADASLREACQ